MNKKQRKLFSSRKQFISVIIIVVITLLVTTVISCILLFGLNAAFSKEISSAYKSTVSRISDEINGFGDILKESSAESSITPQESSNNQQ